MQWLVYNLYFLAKVTSASKKLWIVDQKVWFCQINVALVLLFHLVLAGNGLFCNVPFFTSDGFIECMKLQIY